MAHPRGLRTRLPHRRTMHIYEGILAGTVHGREVMLLGAAGAAVGTAIGLWKMDYERVPQVGVLTAAFFVVVCLPSPSLRSRTSGSALSTRTVIV